MRLPIIVLSIFTIPFLSISQNRFPSQAGNFSLGVRGTLSTFSHGENENGYGAGGHFRVQLADRVNTEWFLDVISNDINKRAQRMDYHIGWSVMFYPIDTRAFTRPITPYIVAGHCFDNTRVSINSSNERKTRWSSAVQAGAGFHYNITPRFDISPTVQYMLHLGRELHVHAPDEGAVEIEEHKHAGWEGHLLFNISANYKLFRLWTPKK